MRNNINGWMVSTIILVIVCSGLLANITLRECPECPDCNTVDCVKMTDTVVYNYTECSCPDAIDECIKLIRDVDRIEQQVNDGRI